MSVSSDFLCRDNSLKESSMGRVMRRHPHVLSGGATPLVDVGDIRREAVGGRGRRRRLAPPLHVLSGLVR
ncbi:hypothetical protein EVAR_86717_1 [Eumeta japonica]|uniref:Uncharacterized protein n=1 Tax=Eumeta variegata TaxID=151549 RepID=A0A4C1ZI78_EUMVA|nr:hypothetical protein EVAR_86717_1 [Eumeta japonica]